MKKDVAQTRKQPLDIYSTNQIAVGAVDTSGAIRADNDQGLVQLVWKYFGEEVGEALHEIQQGLAPAKGRSITGNSQKL